MDDDAYGILRLPTVRRDQRRADADGRRGPTQQGRPPALGPFQPLAIRAQGGLTA